MNQTIFVKARDKSLARRTGLLWIMLSIERECDWQLTVRLRVFNHKQNILYEGNHFHKSHLTYKV